MNSKSNGARIGRVRKLKLVLCPSLVLVTLLAGLCQACLGQGDAILEAPGLAPLPTPLASGAATLFQNVRIFDGKSAALSAPSDVLVRDNTIEHISASPITIDTNANVRVIAANGRVLMPGLIDEIFCSMPGLPADRDLIWPRWSAGTRLPRHSRWPPQTMAS